MKKKNTVFYKCSICGNVIGLMQGDINNMKCCGKDMELIPENDGVKQQYNPTYEKVEDEIFVKVEHPMEKGNYIAWIAQVSDNQTTRIRLYPEQNAQVRFKYIPQSTIYAYCNKGELFKTYVE